MKNALLITLLFSISIFSQESIETRFIEKTILNIDKLVDVDDFNTIYYIDNDVFYKRNNDKTISYNNLQLGNITSANQNVIINDVTPPTADNLEDSLLSFDLNNLPVVTFSDECSDVTIEYSQYEAIQAC